MTDLEPRADHAALAVRGAVRAGADTPGAEQGSPEHAGTKPPDPSPEPREPREPQSAGQLARKRKRDRVVPELAAGATRPSERPARVSEPAAVLLASDLLRWIIPKVGAFPKSVRYGLGSRIEAAHLDVFEELIRAQYCRGHDRVCALEHANLRLQVARHLVRVAHELRLIPENSAVYAAKLQVDLGTQVGAWRKASASTASSSGPSAIQPI